MLVNFEVYDSETKMKFPYFTRENFTWLPNRLLCKKKRLQKDSMKNTFKFEFKDSAQNAL